MKHSEILHEIVHGSRATKINCIIENAGDEFESRNDLIELAKKTDTALNIELQGILEYFNREDEEDSIL